MFPSDVSPGTVRLPTLCLVKHNITLNMTCHPHFMCLYVSFVGCVAAWQATPNATILPCSVMGWVAREPLWRKKLPPSVRPSVLVRTCEYGDERESRTTCGGRKPRTCNDTGVIFRENDYSSRHLHVAQGSRAICSNIQRGET